MSRQHPIWNNVTACNYNTNKSYGITNTGEVNILVGSSSKNSNQFLKHITTRTFKDHKKYGAVVMFRFSVDGVILKEMIFKDEKGKPGKLLKTRTKLKSIKSL